MDFVFLLKSSMLQVLLHDASHHYRRTHTHSHIKQMTMIVNDWVKVKSLIRID